MKSSAPKKSWYQHKLLVFALVFFAFGCLSQYLVAAMYGAEWRYTPKVLSEAELREKQAVEKSLQRYDYCQNDIAARCPKDTTILTMDACLAQHVADLAKTCREAVEEFQKEMAALP